MHIQLSIILLTLILHNQCSPTPTTNQAARQWQEDLRFFQTEFPMRHINPFHTTSKEIFDRAVDNLYRQIPNLTDQQIKVEFARLGVLIGDGHSGIRLFSDKAVGFRSYPLELYQFEDGLYVTRAGVQYARAAGAKVESIGDLTVDEVIAAVAPLIPKDNYMYTKVFAPFFLVSPDILRAVGTTNSMDPIAFVLSKDGDTFTITPESAGPFMLKGHELYPSGLDHVIWVDALPEHTSAPVWMPYGASDAYWFEYMLETGTVFCQFNIVQDKDEESLADFAARLKRFIQDNKVDRLVIDLRHNRGGNKELVRALTRAIVEMEAINTRGKLFAIIGRRTFSAAQTFVNDLEQYTDVIFVGEPTAQNVAQYGDSHKIVLPNSGLTVRASFVYYNRVSPDDHRQWTAPHISITYSHTDYLKGLDPALEAILVWKPQRTLQEQLTQLVEKGNYHAILPAYQRFKAQPQNRYAYQEITLIRTAVALFGKESGETAEKLLHEIIHDYPQTFYGHYFLGELLSGTDRIEEALTHYRMAMANDPKGRVGFDAEKKLISLTQ